MNGDDASSRGGDLPLAGDDDEGFALVCGLCRQRLEGRHATRAKADEAADDHVLEEHPDRDEVVVLTVPVSQMESDRERIREQAIAGQRQVDEDEQAQS